MTEQQVSNCSSGACSQLRAQIGPSILNANLALLADEAESLLNNGADYLHLDVMDGHFVPNLTFGAPVVASLRSELSRRGQSKAFFDMHMMVAEPERWIASMADAGATSYTFHVEAIGPQGDVSTCIRKIREAGMKVGLAVNPKTSIDVVLEYVPKVDSLLVMTVEPGFGGQSFMHDCLSKVQTLRNKYTEIDIQVDGGVGPSTIDACAKAGANLIVSGTAVIRSQEPAKVIKILRDRVEAQIHKKSASLH